MDAMPSVRRDYFSSPMPSERRSADSGSSSGANGGSSVVNNYSITIPIENFYGEEKEFDRLKKTVESAMQKTNSKTVNALFKNPQHQSITQQ
jgi:hypothetical protein